jgi:hypothetical protein
MIIIALYLLIKTAIMFSHRTFLILGSVVATDILSLMKGGYEVEYCNFSFNQAIDNKGKATTKVQGGTMSITLSQLPPQPVIEWGMKSRKLVDGVIVTLDTNNLPMEKIFFKQAACVNLEVNYTQTGDSYTETKIVIQAAQLIVGDGVEFENEWIKH